MTRASPYAIWVYDFTHAHARCICCLPSPLLPPALASSISTPLTLLPLLFRDHARAHAHTDTLSIHQIVENWDPHYGDRCTELVIIGLHMDEKKVKAALDKALVAPVGELKKCCQEGRCQNVKVEEEACKRGMGQVWKSMLPGAILAGVASHFGCVSLL